MIEVNALNYTINNKKILKDINLKIKKGEITTIIGPNGCGKSTLLKNISRVYKPSSGSIFINDKNIKDFKHKELAKIMAILPQHKHISSGIKVKQLVEFGRYPHTKTFGRLTTEDYSLIKNAIALTNMEKFLDRDVSTLSGGENQMAWITMCLAQNTEILMLDEPTTFLDISYQIEVLELVKRINKELKTTIVMVLHDINQAAKYSDNIEVIRAGESYLSGSPDEVFRLKTFNDVFDVSMDKFMCNNNNYYVPKKKC